MPGPQVPLFQGNFSYQNNVQFVATLYLDVLQWHVSIERYARIFAPSGT